MNKGLVVILVVAALFVGFTVGRVTVKGEPQEAVVVVPVEAPVEVAPVVPKAPLVITMAEFEKIVEGMERKDVRRIVGADGERTVFFEVAGQTTAKYTWTNPDGRGWAEVEFVDDRVTAKKQIGIDSDL